MGLQQLKNEATLSTTFRGHHLGEWQDVVDERGSLNECLECGKKVCVVVKPLPNEIDIGGEAVALSCTDQSKDTFLVPYLGIKSSYKLAMETWGINPTIIEEILTTVEDYVETAFGDD